MTIQIACERPTLLADVVQELRSRGQDVRNGSYTDAAPDVTTLVVVPSIGARDTNDLWAAVNDELTRNFELIQQHVKRRIESNSVGHVVALLPAAAAMGNPSDVAASALVGGMLSLVRTLTLEFRKLGMSANAVMFDFRGDALAHAEDVAAMVQTLVTQPGHAITGQTIYACAGSDAGRLHP